MQACNEDLMPETPLMPGTPKRAADVRYSTVIAQRILRELRTGRSLRSICAHDDLPTESAVRKWVQTDRNRFAARYLRARTAGDRALAKRRAKIMDRILDQLASGRTLYGICRDKGMPPHNTVLGWAAEDRPSYDLARRMGYDAMADEILEIADDSRGDWIRKADGSLMLDRANIARSARRVRALQWRLAKALPRK